MDKKQKFLTVFTVLLQILLMSEVNARDHSQDIYVYEPKGLYFANKSEKLEKYYYRANREIRGIDVSKWQGDIDWRKVKESGISFAMIRDGYGIKSPKQVDTHFHKNMKEAKANGINCGVYHYSYAANRDEAVAEADFCLETIKGYKFEYPVSFDMEEKRFIHLGREKLTEICEAFCDRMRQRGYYVTIYTYYYWIKDYLIADRLFSKYDLWLARYNWTPGYTCGMWQHSSEGTLNGITERVDFDIAYFDYPKINKELHLNGF